jgi:hypothetical protein
MLKFLRAVADVMSELQADAAEQFGLMLFSFFNVHSV